MTEDCEIGGERGFSGLVERGIHTVESELLTALAGVLSTCIATLAGCGASASDAEGQAMLLI